MTYQFGIIGCRHGHIAVFLEEMLALGHECVGIYDADDLKIAEQLAEQYNVPIVDSREAFDKPSVQFIGSSAINSEKIEVIEWCEQRNKHIMVDKPAVTDRSGLERLEAVIQRGRIQIGMLLTERYRSSIYTLKREVAAGRLGKIVNISARKPHRLHPATRPDWHFSKQQNGGIIVDLFVHDFDLLRWLSGQEPVSVQAYMAKNELPQYPDFYDVAAAQIVMDGGAVGHLYADWHTPDGSWTWGDCRLFINGTLGFAELRLNGDPSVSSEDELYLQVTDVQPWQRVELTKPERTLTAEFLLRVKGEQAELSQEDVLAASRWSVQADELAVIRDCTQL